MPQRPASSWNTPRLRGRFQTQRFNVARRSSLLSCLRFPLWCRSDKYDCVFSVQRLIGGLAIVPASVLPPAYIAEMSLSKNRGTLVSPNQLTSVIGILGRLSRQLKTIEDGRSQSLAVAFSTD